MCHEGHGVGTAPICGRRASDISPNPSNSGKKKGLTNRHSCTSANGFVVNHSHMKALVDPSFTEFNKPRMSLFTEKGEHHASPLARFDTAKNIRGTRGGPRKLSWSVGHPCCRAITYAIVWLPLPYREIPRVVPWRSEMHS